MKTAEEDSPSLDHTQSAAKIKDLIRYNDWLLEENNVVINQKISRDVVVVVLYGVRLIHNLPKM